MAMDLTREVPITLAAAAKLFPKNARGKHPHVSQLYRYSTRGLRGIVLETIQAGAKKCTSREAVFRFFAGLSARNQVADVAPTEELPSRHEEVDRELDRLGISVRTVSQRRHA